jgi:hypothetical protein
VEPELVLYKRGQYGKHDFLGYIREFGTEAAEPRHQTAGVACQCGLPRGVDNRGGLGGSRLRVGARLVEFAEDSLIVKPKLMFIWADCAWDIKI